MIASSTTPNARVADRGVGRGRPADLRREAADVHARGVDRGRRSRRADRRDPSTRVPAALRRRYREARRRVESGELGTVYLVRLIAHDNAPPSEAYIASSGGLFRDSSVHDFDAIRFVTGREVERVVAVGSGPRVGRLRPKHDDVDTAGAILTMDDGTLGDPVPDSPQPARLRHPDGGRRIPRCGVGRCGTADAVAVARGRGADRYGRLGGLPDPVRRCVPRGARGVPRRRPRPRAEPVHRPGRARGNARGRCRHDERPRRRDR